MSNINFFFCSARFLLKKNFCDVQYWILGEVEGLDEHVPTVWYAINNILLWKCMHTFVLS